LNYFIFDFRRDLHLIESFLDAASDAHNQARKTKEWFLWKFKDNPFGETILACVEDKDKIVGCVAYGFQNFIGSNAYIRGGLSFETFIHPDYQGQGIFKKLIIEGEKRARSLGIQFLLNFPNKNSLPGFTKMGWQKLDIAENWIRLKINFRTLFILKEFKKGFVASGSNYKEIINNLPISFQQTDSNYLYSEINLDYLKWRFFSFPNSEYAIIENEKITSIGRVGYRGKAKEVQILFVNPKSRLNINFKEVLDNYQAITNCDIINFPISKSNSIKDYLKKCRFIKVPGSTNVCYKILDSNLKIDLNKISLSAINYHTY